jgi:hypothetical protein
MPSIAWKIRWLVTNKVERLWKEVGVAQLNALSRHLPAGSQQTKRRLCQDSQSPSWHLNPDSTEYKAGDLTTQPQLPVNEKRATEHKTNERCSGVCAVQTFPFLKWSLQRTCTSLCIKSLQIQAPVQFKLNMMQEPRCIRFEHCHFQQLPL